MASSADDLLDRLLKAGAASVAVGGLLWVIFILGTSLVDQISADVRDIAKAWTNLSSVVERMSVTQDREFAAMARANAELAVAIDRLAAALEKDRSAWHTTEHRIWSGYRDVDH